MSFLKNAWYMIAWASEIGETPFTRKILDTSIVLYRQDESIVALANRCPHRFAPLSNGQIVGGNIQCPYHGLQFDRHGTCVANPLSPVAPSAAKVRSFPVRDLHGAVWIWMGDFGAADSAAIPTIPHHADLEVEKVTGTTLAQADYRLLSDNLMDLTHTAFLHPALGGRDYVPKVRSWEDSGTIVVEFLVSDLPNFFGEEVIPGHTVRHRDTIHWHAPSVHVLTSQTSQAGSDEPVIVIPSAHILTPETATTTHYFWSSVVPVGFAPEMMREVLIQAFDHEDKPMVEAVQKMMGDKDLWELNPVLLASDVGAVRVRRKLAALIEAEQANTTAVAGVCTHVAR
ncbi:aromatic ring-hydroxylating dioxygenase subunit alpha [Paraburkholderia acidiphila]|uniref:Rieske 2Fe-2S domain-containing protein n=1 Tax=Paraburkholderia acidiphila TaxID=2571747 RepID=A0A7Z2G803_9BURK|nr:aromatic ring-hydroxylating dioxygenase subunit alpha [Paraburkholderia acidiphila]QGZ56892.1 Rieske 2Fe-2S domain-containing protein [Paraburkholderia acidiphila]